MQARGYYHVQCAQQLSEQGQLELVPPLCRHWQSRGYCLLGEKCFYRWECGSANGCLAAAPWA